MSNFEKTPPNIRVEHFVRETLGCTCPDDVFKDIRQPDPCAVFASAYAVYEIGGRLCVAVFVPANWCDLAQKLGQLVADGMQYRDQHGFNRFRLVIACSDDDAVTQLPQAFDALPNIDDKVHLHVVPPNQLPVDVTAKAI
jgi:hypothetical protein